MVVELARIVEKKHVVDIERVIAAAIGADGHRVGVRFSIRSEDREHLLRPDANAGRNLLGFGIRCRSLNHIRDLEFLQRWQYACGMLEVQMPSRVREIGNLIACLDPNGLSREVFFRRLEIGRVYLRRHNIIVGVQV